MDLVPHLHGKGYRPRRFRCAPNPDAFRRRLREPFDTIPAGDVLSFVHQACGVASSSTGCRPNMAIFVQSAGRETFHAGHAIHPF